MGAGEPRAPAEWLADLHKRFAYVIGRRESRGHSFSYILALLQADGRKSVERMALEFGGLWGAERKLSQAVVLAWQRFLTVCPWGRGGAARNPGGLYRGVRACGPAVAAGHGGGDG